MHSVQLVEVGDSELVQTRLRLLVDQSAEVVLCILSLLHFSLQNFFELVDFSEGG